LIYMDNILIFSKDLDNLRQKTLDVLKKLQDNDLYLNLDKCIFEAKEVEYLGMIIRENEIAMDPTKLAGIADWPTLTTVKQVRSFLGFGNFYQRFIGHYTDISRPLTWMMKKDLKWDWTDECQGTFDTLKKKFMEAPVLRMPDKSQPFIVESDKKAIGAVIRQQDKNGDWHPCGYISHSFNDAEQKYEIYDRELLGIVRALKNWRHYLEGSEFPTAVLSDHKNLTYFRTAQKLNRRQAGYSLFLSQSDMKLVHTPGTKMIQLDALSRRSDYIHGEDTDNENKILLPDDIFIKLIDTKLAEEIKNAVGKDELFAKALEVLKQTGTPPIKSDLSDWKFEEGLLFFKSRCYVPPDADLRWQIVKRYHDTKPAGHPGQWGTQNLVSREYWWPGMGIIIKKYVDRCATCQQMKVNMHPTKPGSMPIPTVKDTRPFSRITCDFITDLPESDGFDSLMGAVDHGLTKGVIAIPCTKKIDAIGTTNFVLEHVYK
jgi:hypothetical protein